MLSLLHSWEGCGNPFFEMYTGLQCLKLPSETIGSYLTRIPLKLCSLEALLKPCLFRTSNTCSVSLTFSLVDITWYYLGKTFIYWLVSELDFLAYWLSKFSHLIRGLGNSWFYFDWCFEIESFLFYKSSFPFWDLGLEIGWFTIHIFLGYISCHCGEEQPALGGGRIWDRTGLTNQVTYLYL